MAGQSADNLFMLDHSIFSIYDDRVMLEGVQGTHDLDEFPLDVDALLYVVEDIFNSPAPIIDGISVPAEYAHTEASTGMAYTQDSVFKAFPFLIDQISCKIECKCTLDEAALAGGTLDGMSAPTPSILYIVSKYRWDSKLALILSALAVKYGVFLLIVQSYTSNQFTKSLAIIKQLPEILDQPEILKPRFDKIRFLMKNMLDITKCIMEIYKLPEEYITKDFTDQISLAVYWTIRSVLICASQIADITDLEGEKSSWFTENIELDILNERLREKHSYLSTQLDACYKLNLIYVFDTMHIDNMKALKALFNPIDYLYHGSTKKRVNIDVLRKMHVLLFISDLDILQEELFILETIYNDSWQQTENYYDVVWLPVLGPAVSWNENEKKQFELLQANMTWYILQEPWLINSAAPEFIKEKLEFNRKPILVGLDPHGKVACKNAFPMMWIWRSLAYPFTSSREKSLWEEQTWGLDFLVNGVDQLILKWMADGKYICLYGGEDMEWIRIFTTTTRNVAQAANIPLEMVYVGKSNPKESVWRTMETIKAEKLSHCLQDLASVWYFWVRIRSMWESRHQAAKYETGKITEFFENDYFAQEITAMISYGGSEEGWALISKGSAELTRGKGDVYLNCLSEYNLWKDLIPQKEFIQALKDHLLQLHSPHHYSKVILPATAGLIPEKVVCAECGRPTEKFFMYECSVE